MLNEADFTPNDDEVKVLHLLDGSHFVFLQEFKF